MLKSFSSQIAATLFFGPLGLAYSSVAAAVFLTLVLAVLFFTELGVLSLLIVWPLSIIVGMVFVKLHNDQIRSSGSRLLLGPGDDYEEVTSAGSWGRGIAVLALLVVGAFVAYSYLPDSKETLNRIVQSERTQQAPAAQTVETTTVVASVAAEAAENIATVDAVSENNTTTTAVIAARASNDENNEDFAVIALPEREIATVIIDNDGNVEQGEADSALNSGRPQLTVDAPLVNLRRGPGTGFDIITTVEAGEQLFEFARDGNWINVETASNGFTGWIYSTLVR